MPIVKVEMYAGRTKEQKAELAKAITDAVVNIARTTADETIVNMPIVSRDVRREDQGAEGGAGQGHNRRGGQHSPHYRRRDHCDFH